MAAKKSGGGSGKRGRSASKGRFVKQSTVLGRSPSPFRSRSANSDLNSSFDIALYSHRRPAW